MIIFLFGQDSYRAKEKLNEIVAHYKKVHQTGLNLKYFEGENLTFQDFRDEFKQGPMFKEKKLFVVKNIFSNSEFKKNFLANKDIFLNSENIILFFEDKEIKEGDQFFEFLKKNSLFQEFKSLEGERLKNWIKKKFKEYQVLVNQEVIETLIERVGNNLWQMEKEIQKLVSFKNGKEIRKEDVEILVEPKIETDIFKTIDLISQRKKTQALYLIHRHLETGTHPLYLFSMINFQFRNLLIIKELSKNYLSYNLISQLSGLHPYLVKQNYWRTQNFDFFRLKKIYQKMFQLDFDIKTGRLEPHLALDLFIAEI